MDSMVPQPAAGHIGPLSEIQRRRSTGCPDRKRAASSAGRISLRMRRRSRQRAPANDRLATVAKPCSSLRSASSRCAMRSPDGSSPARRVAGVDLDAVAVDAPAAAGQQHRAGLADDPGAEPARLEHEPGAGVQLARLVADEVAEQADGALLGSVGLARPRAQDVGPALRVELGDDPGVRQAGERDRQRERLRPHEQRGGGDERHDVEGDAQRPEAALVAQPRGVDARAPVERLGLRQHVLDRRHARGARSAAGDRQAQDHEVGVDRQLADLLGLAGPGRDHREIAAVELGAERRAPPPRRRPDRRPSTRRPSSDRCDPCG